MGQAIEITTTYSSSELRKLARLEKDGKVASRLLAIAAILEGVSRTVAARQAGMDRQTLCDWVHHFNRDGPSGLHNGAKGHPPRRLSAEQEAEMRTRVLSGPDPAMDGLVRWRCVDVQRFIAETYKVQYHVRSVGRLS